MATVFVALACTGRIPMPSSAGNDRNDPPPATAFSTPAKKAATTSHTQRQSRFAAEAGKVHEADCIRAGRPPISCRHETSCPTRGSSNQIILFRAQMRHRILSTCPRFPFAESLSGFACCRALGSLFALPGALAAQTIVTVSPQQCVWRAGDNPAWAAPNLDETGWQPYTHWKPQSGQAAFLGSLPRRPERS